MTPEQARDIAHSACVYMLEDPELAAGFFGRTGLDPSALRAVIDLPDFLCQVLEYMSETDERLMRFALLENIDPARAGLARKVLSGRDD